MPRSASLTKEIIVEKGLDIVRKGGTNALTARALSKELGCSLSPIFTVFDNMEDIHEAVKKAAVTTFVDYAKDALNYVPAFKEYGLRVVRFANEDPELFKIAFLTPDSAENELNEIVAACIAAMERTYQITHEDGIKLFYGVWTFSCGLALLTSSGAVKYSEEEISLKLTEQFVSVLLYIKGDKRVGAITPQKRAEGEDMTLVLDFDRQTK